jgi:hypothetical protein
VSSSQPRASLPEQAQNNEDGEGADQHAAQYDQQVYRLKQSFRHVDLLSRSLVQAFIAESFGGR